MMTFNQSKSSLFAMLLLLANWAGAQTFWSTDFGNQATATTNWVTTGSVNPGTLNWEWTNNPNAGFQDPNGVVGNFAAPTASNGYFLFNSDGNGDVTHDVRLSGPATPINCSGKMNVSLRFFSEYAHFPAAGDSKVYIGVSTDGTNFTYKQIFADVPGNSIFENFIEVDLPAADNQPQVWLQFRWEGTYEYHWKIDDVELLDVPLAMPKVTFRVNMATQTVNPGGVFLSGTFNGWTNEAMTNAGGGVWELTKTLTQNTAYQYKFKNGANGAENNPGLLACGINDGTGNINRVYTAGTTDETLAAVCFNSCSPCVLSCNQNPDAIICDNFDTYNTTQKLAQQSPTNWGLWSNGPGGTNEDGIIVTSPVSSAPNALKVEATAAAGGPMDLMLKLQNKTTGNYSLKWKMFIPTGKQAYYNMQNVIPIGGGAWNFEVFFNNGGDGDLQLSQVSARKFSFPYNTWFTVEHRIDLDNNLMEYWVNGTMAGTIAYPNNIGGANFYGINNSHLYYVDDVEYVKLAPTVYNADICDNAINLNPYIGLAAGTVSTAGPYDITNATLSATDPTNGFECHFQSDPLQGNHWFTFVGDGNRYTILSKDCGSSPIPDGDNQFALYSGQCGNLTPIACNDDVTSTDLHASLTFPTTAGTTYYLMVDSYNGLNGTYCLNISQVGNIGCAQGAVGTNTVSGNGTVCWGDNLNQILQVTPSTYSIPNTLPGVSGHIWCISSSPLDPTVWPGTIQGIASTGASPTVGVLSLPNNGSNIQPGVYYLTSVVCAGGTLINPSAPARIFNIDISNGCFFVGQSHQITLLPEIETFTILNSITNATAPGWNGAINLTIGGGSAPVFGVPYQIKWSNGATTEDISGLAPGTYTVTITEPTGCVPNGIATFTVGGFVSGTADPAVVNQFSIAPNPTAGMVMLRMELAEAVEVRVDVVNALGQAVITRHLGTTNAVNQEIDLSNLAEGTYFLRTTLDGAVAVRTVVVSK